MMTIYNCDIRDGIIFHFNKMSITDPSVPMWVVKHKGKTYYVHHMEVNSGVGFSTKETPNNTHTKGSIKMKGRLMIHNIDEQVTAKVY